MTAFDPPTDDDHLARARVSLGHGDLTGAEQALELALGVAPDDVEALILLGHARGRQGQLGGAIQCYQDALRLDDASTPARFYLAEVLVRSGEVVRASSQLHLVLKRAPTYGPGFALRGDIALHHGDHRQAAADYCQAIRLETADAAIYERLGRAFLAIGDPAQALKALDGAIHLEPDLWDAYEAAAVLCEAVGWVARSRRYWDALTYVPGRRDAALEALRRVVGAIAARGRGDVDLPGAPPELVELTGFKPPPTLDAAPRSRPGSRVLGAPPPLADLLSAPPPSTRAGRIASDGFGTSGAAAGYLDAFRDPPPLAPEPEPAPEPVPEPAPAQAQGPVMDQLGALQSKLKNWLK